MYPHKKQKLSRMTEGVTQLYHFILFSVLETCHLNNCTHFASNAEEFRLVVKSVHCMLGRSPYVLEVGRWHFVVNPGTYSLLHFLERKKDLQWNFHKYQVIYSTSRACDQSSNDNCADVLFTKKVSSS